MMDRGTRSYNTEMQIFLNSYIRNDMLDDFYDENIKKLVLAIVMSIAIAYPEMNINCATTVVAFDGQDYKKEQFFSYYPIHNEAAKEYGQLFEQEVSFDTCFCWIKKKYKSGGWKGTIPHNLFLHCHMFLIGKCMKYLFILLLD